MRVFPLLLVVIGTVYCTGICFSQETQSGPAHSVIKNPKGSLSNAPVASSTLDVMFRSLKNITANSQRADLYFFVSKYYADRLKIDSALYYSEKVREESQAGNYEKGMAKHFLSKSYALFYRGKTDIATLGESLVIFTRFKDDLFCGYVYKELGRQYDRLDLIDNSRKNYHISIGFLLKAGETREVQRVYYELGMGFYQTYKADSAAHYLFAALELAEKLNDPGRIFNASGMLGELYLGNDNVSKAAKYLKYALDSRTSSTSRIMVRNRLSSFAMCLALQGEFEKADEIIREYEAINEKLGDSWGDINLSTVRGIYFFHRKNYPVALTHFQLAYNRINEIKSFNFDIKNIVNYLGRTEYQLGHYDSAILHLAFVRQLASQLKYGADMLDANLLIALSWEKKGRMDSAYHYFRIYDHIKDSLLTFQKEKAVIELTTKYETDKKEKEIQLLHREKELNAYQLRSKIDEIEKQNLAAAQKSQQLALLSQQNEISRLETSEKTLAFQNQQKEMVKNQKEFDLMAKENELQSAIAGKESQRKNFAYMAIAAVLVFSAYLFYRYTKNKKLSRQLAVSLIDLKLAQEQLVQTEKEKESENIRVRISRDIHDEVGATLSGVALFSEIAREKINQRETKEAQIYLDHITANSKEMVEKMSDIVWTINPGNDSFERIIAKLQSYAVNLCAGKGIRLHLTIDDAIRSYYPSMQVRRNIYMLLKEAINNAVKYSEGKNIFLLLQSKQDVMTVELRDDGKGFDKEARQEGNGLNNMQARAKDLEAKFSIDSEEGKGTCIRLEFYFHPAGGHREAV